jgi:hypothetical protein
MITPSIPFMFFGTDVNGHHVYRVYNDPRKFVALTHLQIKHRKVGSEYMFLDYSKMFTLEMEREESQ